MVFRRCEALRAEIRVRRWAQFAVAATLSSALLLADKGAIKAAPPGDGKADSPDWSTPLKHISLNDSGDIYLSLAGELRERFEYYNEPLFGVRGIAEDDYLFHRLLLSLDLHVGSQFRFYLQFGDSLEVGKEAPRSPTDVDELDIQQAYFDVVFPFDASTSLTLRAGRQEMTFGSARLISVREGANVRRSFDGARVTFADGKAVTIDAFLVRSVRLEVGAFNDEPEQNETLWGVYGVVPLPALPDGHVDLYYLGLQRNGAIFQQGTADELRHTFGARLWGKPGAWDYNYEAVIQAGTFGRADILAWTVATDTGYTFASAHFTPRLSLKADIASGDSNPRDDQLTTFNALFPKQPYFGEATLLAPANIIDLHPSVALHVNKQLSLTTDVDFFWKERSEDAIYAPPGRPLIRAGRSDSHYTGSQVNTDLAWEINRNLSLVLYYSHFFAGPAVTEAGGRSVDFVGSWVTWHF